MFARSQASVRVRRVVEKLFPYSLSTLDKKKTQTHTHTHQFYILHVRVGFFSSIHALSPVPMIEYKSRCDLARQIKVDYLGIKIKITHLIFVWLLVCENYSGITKKINNALFYINIYIDVKI